MGVSGTSEDCSKSLFENRFKKLVLIFGDLVIIFRVVKMVILENSGFVPYRKQVVMTKIGENSGFAILGSKQFP